MAQITLRKLFNKKEVLAVIHNLVDAQGISIRIADIQGHILLGSESKISETSYPIELSGEVIGWVIGEEKAAAIASLVSYLVKQEFEKKELASELLLKYQEIDLLQDISTQITASLNLKEVAQLVIEEAGELIESTQGSILLLNQKTGFFETLAEFGQGFYPQEPLILGKGIIGTIVQMGKGEIVNNVASDPRFIDTEEQQIKSLICVPLKTKDRVLGAIAIGSKTTVTYAAEDLRLLTVLALQAAVAIEKALLYEQSCTTALVAQEQAQKLQRTIDELQQTQAQLIQSEKMSGLGQLVAGIAHELNNPINFIYGNLAHTSQYAQDLLQLLHLYTKHYPSPAPEIQFQSEAIDLDFLIEDLPKLLSSMEIGADRIRQIVLSLRNFSRLDEAGMKPVDIHDGIDSTLLILQHRLKARGRYQGIQIIKNYGQLPLVECYAGQMNQVFMNIISNAIDAIETQEQPGFITIYTSLSSDVAEPNMPPSPPSAVICIRDNGSGMSEAVKKRIFDPFFTTKPVGKGTGLGMSISYQIVVEKHGGVLKCLSQPGQGTEFWIQIPLAPIARSHADRDKHHADDLITPGQQAYHHQYQCCSPVGDSSLAI